MLKSMKSFRRRGVALITVVMITFLLAMLTSALMANHQSNFAILGDSINQRQSTLAASSGLDYAKFRLGRERTLGQSNASFTERSPAGATWKLPRASISPALGPFCQLDAPPRL